MRKAFILLFAAVLLTGCGLLENILKDEEVQPETSEAKTETQQQEQPEETAEEIPVSTEEGVEVEITGEVTVSEDGITIQGESNLLPETSIRSGGVTIHDFASATFIDAARVQDDGSFSFSFPPIGTSTFVDLGLNPRTDEGEALYGEHLENVTGPQVYLTDTHGEFKVMADFFIDVNREMPYTIPIEVPDWKEKPDDYGDPNVWMKAEYETDHNYIYFKGESNLMEGAKIGGNLRFASGQIEPFSYDFTRVNPDGTFELKVRYHVLKKGMYMPITYKPSSNSWEDVVSIYGEHGENLEGDLVFEDNDEQVAELIVELDAPDYDPPEDVGLTVEDEEVKIQMPDDLLFDFDESKLKGNAKETLDGVLSDLEKLKDGTEIQINGHTDNEGALDYNLTLSEERAEAVWSYLKKYGDVDKFNVEVEGYGAEKPIASNDDSDGRARNRRVEIVINPK